MDTITRTEVEESSLRHDREHKPFYHPRTLEKISCVTTDTPHKPTTEHLNRFPCVAYNRRMNARLINGKFILEGGKITFKGQTKNDTFPIYERTAQYKTVWYSKGNRRR